MIILVGQEKNHKATHKERVMRRVIIYKITDNITPLFSFVVEIWIRNHNDYLKSNDNN